MTDIDYFEVERKLDRVAGEAHNAVYGFVRGLRDGSPYTMDRCRELGLALTRVMHYIKHDESKHQVLLPNAINELKELEQRWRDKGHRLPYE